MDSGSSLSTSSSAAAAAAAAGPVSSSSSWSSSTTAAAMNASIPNGATSSSGTGAGLSFSLLCHNILAPVWCRPEWFTGIHSQLLDTEQRCRIICSNIQRWSPDIICLQVWWFCWLCLCSKYSVPLPALVSFSSNTVSR